MGAKSGPCTHCGITSTPLWRRGPPEKPILCNACGSRWRHRGTLAGYMPMQVTGLSTCHVPSGFVAPDEPANPLVKPTGSLKRKERPERVSQESERGMSDRLRERRDKDGYDMDGLEGSLSAQAARRKVSPSCSPNSVLPSPPRVRAPASRAGHAWSQATSLLPDFHSFDLDVLTSEEPFAGLADDVTLFPARERDPPAAERPLKSLDAGQYVCGLVVRTRVEALGGPGAWKSSPPASHVAQSQPLSSQLEAQAQSGAPLFPSSARFTLPSRHPPAAPTVQPSWPPASPGLAQLNIAKLQGSDFGNGSPHRASFPDSLLFKGSVGPESLNEFMARTEGDKRLGELAGAHGMPGSHDSLESGASLVLDETREHPTVDLDPPPEQYKALPSPLPAELPLCGGEKGEKDLRELHRMFSAPIWDSLDLDPRGGEKEFGLGRFAVPSAEAGLPV